MPAKPKSASSSSAPPSRPTAHATSPPRSDSSSPAAGGAAAVPTISPGDFKTELLAALRDEMGGLFKSELHSAMTENLSSIKSELQTVKAELSANIAAINTEVNELRGTVSDMEGSLSACTDDIVSLQSKVDKLSTQLIAVENKCEDLEARSRRNNIRILGVDEDYNDPINAATVSALLKEAFGLDKEPTVDRAHRSLQPKPRPGERPRPIIARLHYYADCADILQRARALQRIKIKDMTISVFPDLTPRTARATFNTVQRQLKEIPDIRFGLVYPARLRITSNGVTKEFTSPEDAAKFVEALNK